MQTKRLAKFLRDTISLFTEIFHTHTQKKWLEKKLIPFFLTDFNLNLLTSMFSMPNCLLQLHVFLLPLQITFFSFANLSILPVSFATLFYLWRHSFRNKSICILPVMENNFNPLPFALKHTCSLYPHTSLLCPVW